MSKNYFNLRNVIAIVISLAAVTMFSSCDKEDDNPLTGNQLSGGIFITPSGPVAVGTQLIAHYTEGDKPQSETTEVTFQWKKGSTNITVPPSGEFNLSTYTPDSPGEYSVVVSAAGYQSKTSNIVVVTAVEGEPPGSNIAAKYRGQYPAHSSEYLGGEDVAIGALQAYENSIGWTGGSNGQFTNVSTGSDKAMNWALGGTWAYLYSDNAKIGIILAYSAFGFSERKMLITGHRYVQAFLLTVASSMGITSVDISDIAETVKDVSGEFGTENEEPSPDPDPDPIGGDALLVNASGEAWININGSVFSGYAFYANGDMRTVTGLVSGGSSYTIFGNVLSEYKWSANGSLLNGGSFTNTAYTISGNSLTLYPDIPQLTTVYTKTNIGL